MIKFIQKIDNPVRWCMVLFRTMSIVYCLQFCNALIMQVLPLLTVLYTTAHYHSLPLYEVTISFPTKFFSTAKESPKRN